MSNSSQTKDSGKPHHSRHTESRAVEITRTVTINRPASDVYSFWRAPGNLQRVSDDRVSVTGTSAKSSHWSIRVPGHGPIEWDAEVVNDDPGREIAWQSREGADVPNGGSVRFEPIDAERTQVSLSLTFTPPGKIVALAGKLARPQLAKEIGKALERTKRFLENAAPSS